MISVIHDHGTSFRGLMAYLLHDKDHAKTSERVAWTHTHNLATDDPELGWKFMAATAMSQAELKAEAGIKNTGRKSKSHVMHYTLSWHDEERGELTRDEMMQAALASMTYIGTHEGEKLGKKKKALRTQFAEQHQAIIVCHDEPGTQPHVHIALNRVHPGHGVMLPDSKDYEKLSAWALEYRQAQGKEHYCPERQKNAAKRAQGYLTSHRRKPRKIYETEQEEKSADPSSRKAALLQSHRRRAAELKIESVKMKKKHTSDIHRLEDDHVASEKQERANADDRIQTRTAAIRADYAPKIDALIERQQKEIKVFREGKNTALGHVRNVWAALKTKQWMSEIRTKPLHATTNAFKVAFSSGVQQADIETHHKNELRQLTSDRKKSESQAAIKIRAEQQIRIADLRDRYVVNRNDLILEQDIERAKLKAEWTQLRNDRRSLMSEDDRAPQAKASPENLADQTPGQGQDQKKEAPPLARDHAEQSQDVQRSGTVPDEPETRAQAAQRRARERDAQRKRDKARDEKDREL